MDLKLDTLRKKPKIYGIAVLTVFAALILACVYRLGGERTLLVCCLLTSVYFLAVTALLLRSYFLQMRYNLYSYNTVIYLGFALFTFSIAVADAVLFFRLRDVADGGILPQLVFGLLNSAHNYILLSFPFLFVFSLGLVVSNLSLIRHEGFAPTNLLGLILACMLLGGGAFLLFCGETPIGSGSVFDLFKNLLTALYLYFECMMLGTIAANAVSARQEPPPDRDYVVVLGCAIRKDGTPTPLLRGRLDRALAFATKQEALTGKAPLFVLSGGQGADEVVSEAECMRSYLAERGVPYARMILEDRSTDTAENLRFSARKMTEYAEAAGDNALLPERHPPLPEPSGAKVLFSTTNYHVFRSGLKARRANLRALGIGCRSKWYFWPNAAVREFVGLLTQHRVKQGLLLLGLVAVYALLSWLNLRLGT